MSQPEFYVNPAKFAAAFAVPAEVVDRHIRLAGSAQLKVLLYMLRHGGAGIQDLATALNLAAPDVHDCLQYWLEAGIVLKAGEPAAQPQAPAAESAGTGEKKPPARLKATHLPTREEIARRGAESKEIAYLLGEAQLRFGRIINYSEAATLIWLHDYEGLPVAVILMIIEYALSQGRGTIKYIEKIGMDWASKEINTLQKAEAHLVELAARSKAWSKVAGVFGIEQRRPSAREEEYALRWVETWGFSREMLRAAYERCVDATTKLSLPYINKILEKWHKNNWKKPEQIEADTAPEKKQAKRESSLDLDEIEDLIRRDLFS